MRLLTGLLVFGSAMCTPVVAHGQSAPVQDNAEIAHLFEADQAVRAAIKPEQFQDRAFVTRMIEADRVRRDGTGVLLKAGKVRTANDLYRAAFIFQHGSTSDDYLLAHTLALASAAKGKADAAWIAAATLDRYLQAIGQKQIYGTQYLNRRETGPTMEPYDRELVPDALRETLGVPVLDKQDARLTTMKAAGTLTR